MPDMTVAEVIAISVLLATIGGLVFRLVKLHAEMLRNDIAASDARQSNVHLLRQREDARAEAKAEREQRGYLTVSVAELMLELDSANLKNDRFQDYLRSLGLSDKQIAGIAIGAQLDDPETTS